MKTTAIAFLFGLLTVIPASAQDLPDSPGKDLVVKACTSCHDADHFTDKKHTKEEWKSVVDTMIGYGAEISDSEADIITTYLAKNYGKDAAKAAMPNRDLPTRRVAVAQRGN